jgi:hypothetical protein
MKDNQLNEESKIIHIGNLQEFVDNIKVNAFNITISKLANNKFVFDNLRDDFIDSFSPDILDFELKKFLKINKNDEFTIYRKDINKLVVSLSNEITSHILSKLVDSGKLALCWDKIEKNFIFYPLIPKKKSTTKPKRKPKAKTKTKTKKNT